MPAFLKLVSTIVPLRYFLVIIRSLLLKGVGTAEDADLAVQHGVDVVWVSNHGGRQLDGALGSRGAALLEKYRDYV